MPTNLTAAPPARSFVALTAQALRLSATPSEIALGELVQHGYEEARTVARTLLSQDREELDNISKAVVDAYLSLRQFRTRDDSFPKKLLRDAFFTAYAAKLVDDFDKDKAGVDYNAFSHLLRRVIAHRTRYAN